MTLISDPIWESYLSSKPMLVDKHLRLQKQHKDKKVTIRVYSVEFSSNRYDISSLVEFISNSIESFVFDGSDINNIIEEAGIPYKQAMKYFGYTDPLKDGKYGELLLFLLVETVLKVPMIVHKMKLLTNPNDQIKGGDGLFYGNYQGQASLLVGESKIMMSFNKAIKSAFASLLRFHSKDNGEHWGYELMIAKNNLRRDMTVENLDLLYNILTPGSKEYQNTSLVHPVLIVHNEKEISDIEINSTDKGIAESLLAKHIDSSFLKYHKMISELNKSNSSLSKVYLDFFFIPISDVNDLRHSLFTAIHSIPYKKI